jgi:hypothetical protein
MAIFGWPYFFWRNLIRRSPIGLGFLAWHVKEYEISGKKKYKRKRLPKQPFSITASGLR